MKKALSYFVMAVFMLVCVKCATIKEVADNNITTVTEVVAYYNLNEDHEKYSCYYLNEEGFNTVDSIVTTKRDDIPIKQVVYFMGGDVQVFKSNFKIKDLDLRITYEMYTLERDTLELIELAEGISTGVNIISSSVNTLKADWICFNSFRTCLGLNPIKEYSTYLTKVKGAGIVEQTIGFKLTYQSTAVIVFLLSAACIVLVVWSIMTMKTLNNTG